MGNKYYLYIKCIQAFSFNHSADMLINLLLVECLPNMFIAKYGRADDKVYMRVFFSCALLNIS